MTQPIQTLAVIGLGNKKKVNNSTLLVWLHYPAPDLVRRQEFYGRSNKQVQILLCHRGNAERAVEVHEGLTENVFGHLPDTLDTLDLSTAPGDWPDVTLNAATTIHETFEPTTVKRIDFFFAEEDGLLAVLGYRVAQHLAFGPWGAHVRYFIVTGETTCVGVPLGPSGELEPWTAPESPSA